MVLDMSAEDKILRQKAQHKAWRENNKERVKAYYIYHSSRPEHRERIRLWHSTHRDQINQRARARRLAALASLSALQEQQGVETNSPDENIYTEINGINTS